MQPASLEDAGYCACSFLDKRRDFVEEREVVMEWIQVIEEETFRSGTEVRVYPTEGVSEANSTSTNNRVLSIIDHVMYESMSCE